MSRESAFDRLHPALQHHIVNSLGWRALRPLQEHAIGPVLDGDHALLLAPTAGGKTEAAVFPLLSRMLTEQWGGLSVLYVCPLKALLNNIESRLRTYGALVGRRVALWHGDVGAARRRAVMRERPDLLLTTPESIEVMLVSSRSEPRVLFQDVEAVVVDELHAFAGDDRGWHLLAVLERVQRLAGREIQRLGLSATIGNPEALLEWLAPAASRPRRVVAPSDKAATSAAVQLDYVGNVRNAANVVSALDRGEKRLVFCDSRARVEALAAELRQSGTETFVSHSSLGLDERRRSEEAFSQSRDCVIVATSTLELGIDVGDLDRVIQIDAPATVASFLQRLGRTGRRPGTARNCLFLATSDDGFLRNVRSAPTLARRLRRTRRIAARTVSHLRAAAPGPDSAGRTPRARNVARLAGRDARVPRDSAQASRRHHRVHADAWNAVRRRRDDVDGRRRRARLWPPAFHGSHVGVSPASRSSPCNTGGRSLVSCIRSRFRFAGTDRWCSCLRAGAGRCRTSTGTGASPT